MKTSDSIARVNIDPDGLDFDSLRKDGVELTQNLSGNIWTDYNLHDPGVTILEQLCFGLSELAYEAGESVETFLSDGHGQINFNRFALFKPHDILPSSAVTLQDYCRLIVDAVPDIDAIQVTPVIEPKKPAGLYCISVKLLEPLVGAAFDENKKQDIVSSVRRVFYANRNLAEDVLHIAIESTEPCYLKGSIETTGKRTNAEIYADVFFTCSRKISSNVSIERYEDIYASNKDFTDIFLGPLTNRGFIHSEDFVKGQDANYLQELVGLVSQIDGVKKVYALSLVDENLNPITMENSKGRSFFLKLPQTPELQILLDINFNPGNTTDSGGIASLGPDELNWLLDETKHYLQKLEFQYRAFRNNKSNATTFYELPRGRAHEDLGYYSIQHHFPNVYGINAAGVPRSELPERVVQAKQLKAYLYPFEQLLANSQRQLQSIPKLFSLDYSSTQTYFSQYLDDETIPAIKELYYSAQSTRQKIDLIREQYDNVIDRKNRVLDTMLALYGEEFPQEALKHFNYCYDDDSWILDNKKHYLENIRDISCNRGGASFIEINTHQDSDDNKGEDNVGDDSFKVIMGGLHKKIAILLGIKRFSDYLLLSDLEAIVNVKLVPDSFFTKKTSTLDNTRTVTHLVPALEPKDEAKLKRGKIDIKDKMNVCFSMLQYGVSLDAYRVVQQGDKYGVFFEHKKQQKLVHLKSFADNKQAFFYAHMFKKMLCDINLESEGFHLVEHVLLRSRDSDHKLIGREADFFNHRLSFIFPAWGARFSDVAFRQFAEKTICNQIPAHLFANVYWLELGAMEKFERAYQTWLTCLSSYERKCLAAGDLRKEIKVLDGAAQKLIEFLRQQPKTNICWV